MKEVIVLLLVLNVAVSSAISNKKRRSCTNSSDGETMIESFYFSQKLDHFRLDDDQEWVQRYWVSRTHYKTGGPAFLQINGESTANCSTDFNYSWVSYGKKLHAFCFSLEHRFYGKSWPKNASWRHLSSSQALADIAYFIKGVIDKFQLPTSTKWILFGCSYAGNLAAWARLKYPHLVHGAVASSAPLLSRVDHFERFQNIENALELYDPKCLERIKLGYEEMAAYFNKTKGDSSGVYTMKRVLLYTMIIFRYAVENNDTVEVNIPTVCNTIIYHGGTKLQALVDISNLKWVQKDEKVEGSVDKNSTVENTTEEHSSVGRSVVENSSDENSITENSTVENFIAEIFIDENSAAGNFTIENTAFAFEKFADGNFTFEKSSDENSTFENFADHNFAVENSIIVNSTVENSIDENSAIENSTNENFTFENSKGSTIENFIDENSAIENSTNENFTFQNSKNSIIENLIDENSSIENYTPEGSSNENSTVGNLEVENIAVIHLFDEDPAFEESPAKLFETKYSNPWDYQVCSEIGSFSSYDKTRSFSAVSHLVQMEHFIREKCEVFFGPKIKDFAEKINHANLLQGGLDFNAANTLFIHGSIDPYLTFGLYQMTNDSLYQTILINGTAHCGDYYLESDDDIAELKNARRETLEIIEKWLKT